MMSTEITILIADDHPIFRQGLKQLIEKEPGFRVVSETDNGDSAIELIKNDLPDVAILDLDMPGQDGFSVTRVSKELKLRTKVIVLTMHKDELHINQAIDLGVSGYVIKDGAVYEILNCLKTVKEGYEYFSPALSSVLLKRSRSHLLGGKAGLEVLTPTERRVLYLLSDLKTNREIAAELSISPRTVENHRAHITSKLNLQGAHALVKFALSHKRELE